jgi:hypothetical protein
LAHITTAETSREKILFLVKTEVKNHNESDCARN